MNMCATQVIPSGTSCHFLPHCNGEWTGAVTPTWVWVPRTQASWGQMRHISHPGSKVIAEVRAGELPEDEGRGRVPAAAPRPKAAMGAVICSIKFPPGTRTWGTMEMLLPPPHGEVELWARGADCDGHEDITLSAPALGAPAIALLAP